MALSHAYAYANPTARRPPRDIAPHPNERRAVPARPGATPEVTPDAGTPDARHQCGGDTLDSRPAMPHRERSKGTTP